MKKTALIIMIITIFSKILGFARDISLSYFYGASNISDAYLISVTIPLTVFSFVGIGISTSYIPMYSSIKEKVNMTQADRFTSNIINFLMIICSILILIGLFFTNYIVKIFASGFQGETLELAILLTRISLFGIYFSALTYVFSSYLEIKNNFIIPALVGVPFNFISILTIALSVTFNIEILAIGSVLAIACQLVLLIPYARRLGFRYSINFRDKYIKKVLYLSMPVMFGTSINQINVLVDQTIASRIAIGGISALTYANRLNWFVQGVIVMSIATVMYPMISKMVVDDNIVGLKKTLAESITSISLLILPATFGTIIFAEPIVTFLFARGEFDQEAIKVTSYALVFYSIGMVGFGLREVLSRVFYAFQDTKTPTKNATIGMVLNIVLNIILSRTLGIGGLALATSISATFTTGLMLISLRKKIGSFGMHQIAISLVKILSASLMMAFVAKLLFEFLKDVGILQNLSLMISIGVGAVIYLGMSYFMKIDDVHVLFRTIKNKLNTLT